ncbi:MAG TPA: polymer-forming cytoskeletal protein [Anaeromyxobacteraceae bacterium]
MDSSTIIGESILINGNLNGDEDLTVRGRVEGTVTLTKTLVVEPTGVVKAEVQVKNCVIAGAVVGNVTASESVEITKEGRMVGDIGAPRVIIVDGASFRGRIDMGEFEIREGERPQGPARPAARPSLRRPGGAARVEKVEEPKLPAKPPEPPVPAGLGGAKKKVIVRRK